MKSILTEAEVLAVVFRNAGLGPADELFFTFKGKNYKVEVKKNLVNETVSLEGNEVENEQIFQNQTQEEQPSTANA